MAKEKKKHKYNLLKLIIILIIFIICAILFNYFAQKYGFVARPFTYDIFPFAKV